jgi:hypothetical protein
MSLTLPPFDHFNHNIFEAFAENVLEGVYEPASLKEISLTDAEANELADRIADCAELPDPLRFMRDDPSARFNVFRSSCDWLDFHISGKFADTYEQEFGAVGCSRSLLRRVIARQLPHGWNAALAKWPALDCKSFIPHLDDRIDNMFTQWSDGVMVSFHRGFVLDRPSSDGPALQMNFAHGVEQLEYWRCGKLHHETSEGRAVLKRDLGTGRLIREEYRIEGQLHRPDGPASLEYCETTGRQLFAAYFHLGQMHRDGHPACCYYDDSGRLISEYWYCHGELHRDGAPAVIKRDADSVSLFESYWRRGQQISVTVDRDGVSDVG